jgi:putative thioredoxin
MSHPQPTVLETTEQSFESDVIERSREVPVVVDFWAEWCAPCRALGPRLEALAREYGGKFALVKADTEQCRGIAAAFGVRSIPAVFGLVDGKVVDSFVGALPDSALRAWLDRLLPSPAERLIAEARRLEPSDRAAAEAKYREALGLSPDDPTAAVGLARVLVSAGRLDEARALVDALEARGYLEPDAEKLKAELALHSRAREAGGVEAARSALAAKPDDPTLLLKLAESLAAAGPHEEALDVCLRLVETGRNDVREAARKTMLDIFRSLPEDSPLVGEYRRKLSAALY